MNDKTVLIIGESDVIEAIEHTENWNPQVEFIRLYENQLIDLTDASLLSIIIVEIIASTSYDIFKESIVQLYHIIKRENNPKIQIVMKNGEKTNAVYISRGLSEKQLDKVIDAFINNL